MYYYILNKNETTEQEKHSTSEAEQVCDSWCTHSGYDHTQLHSDQLFHAQHKVPEGLHPPTAAYLAWLLTAALPCGDSSL